MAYQPYYEILGNRTSGYWFRLVASNGQIVVWSEKYTTLASCEQSIAWVRANAPAARIVHNAA